MANTHTSRRTSGGLSERQKRILLYIERFLEDHGYPPTIREIGEAVDIGSTSVVNYNLNKLVKAGYIERAPEVSRGLRLIRTLNDEPVEEFRVGESHDVIRVPMVGKIVASMPVELPGNDFGLYYDEEDLIEVPSYMLDSKYPINEIYALRVNGDSMIDALVNHNDIVVLHRQETASNGDMVAVWLSENSETTLKHFHREGESVRLQPANSTMEPIYVDAKKIQVQGRVLAVLRKLP